MKPLLLALTLGLLTGCAAPKSSPSPRKGTGEWQLHSFPNIGLAIELPDWHMRISDGEKYWTLSAFPLVDQPVAGAQFGVVIAISKHTQKDFEIFYPRRDAGDDLQSWLNARHLQASQKGNDYWLHSRLDIIGTNGLAYHCDGTMKRVGEAREFDRTNRMGGDSRQVGLEMNRIFKSIRVLPAMQPTPP